MQFSLFDLLLLIGITQGVITAVLLLNSKKNPNSNKFLGLGILAFSFLCTKPLLHTFSLWDTHIFRFFPNGLELATAPLIYFYVKSLLTPNFHFKAKYWLHFVPFFISQAYASIIYFTVLSTRDFAEKDRIASYLKFDELKQADEYLLIITASIYLYYAYQMLKSYRKWLDDTISDTAFPSFQWLQSIFLLFIVIWLFLLINHSLKLFSFYPNLGGYQWQALNLLIAFSIYYLGLRGYLQPHYSFAEEEPITVESVPPKLSPTPTQTLELLERAMKEDKLFLNPKLSIQGLSSNLGLPQREVSAAINQHFQVSFRDFINSYRLEEVKLKLNAPAYSHLTILGIALECGFNSEASFYRIFKKHIGMSPKEYIQQEKGV